MGIRFFSDRHRPVHMGPYPLERLDRAAAMPDFADVPAMAGLTFERPDKPESLVNAMGEYQAMLDAIRDGLVNKAKAGCPDDPVERANHIKGFGYFSDASMIGICALPGTALLDEPIRNPAIDRLAHDLKTRQTKTLASGIDMIMADLKESMEAPPSTIDGHSHAIVFLYEYPRDPRPDEPGYGVDQGRAEPSAPACWHRKRRWLSPTTSGCSVSTQRRIPARRPMSTSTGLTVAAGPGAAWKTGSWSIPMSETGSALQRITTDLRNGGGPAAGPARPRNHGSGVQRGPAWWAGAGIRQERLQQGTIFANRRFVDGAHPFETLKRVDEPTTYHRRGAGGAGPQADRHVRARAVRRHGQGGARTGPRAATTRARPRRRWVSGGCSAHSCCCRTAKARRRFIPSTAG